MIVTINFEKAKEIHRERLRRMRAPLLEALDVQFQRALEEGRSTAEVVAEKQRLRDLPELVDAATTLEELSAIKP